MFYRVVFVAVLLLSLVACGAPPPTPAPTPTLTPSLYVHADASLADALSDVRAEFSSKHPELRIEFNFVSSDEMLALLDSGPGTNMVAITDPEVFKQLSEQNRISGLPRVLTRRHLAIVTARGNPKAIRDLKDLDRPGLRVALARPDTRLGQRSRAWIQKLGSAPLLRPGFAKHFIESVIVEPSSGLGILNLIEQQRVDVGIVYATDVPPERDSIHLLDVPSSYNSVENFYLTTFKSGHSDREIQPFINFLYTLYTQNILTTHGFAPPY